jgi:rifampicin phosphotransferase
MLVSLTTSTVASHEEAAPNIVINAATVGGKAASLHKLSTLIVDGGNIVPESFALTVDFFHPWRDELQAKFKVGNVLVDATTCQKLQQACQTLTFNKEQQAVLKTLLTNVALFPAAVRSSAPEEDGAQNSWAGAFVTKLGVSPQSLEQAIRDCFASRFDHRIIKYQQNASAATAVQQYNKVNNNSMGSSTLTAFLDAASFAVVVMAMVDADTAGVAFTANPLNSDRDELVVDSSYGLGESVVDGSITADRYVWDKVAKKVVSEKLGTKTMEKKLQSRGGVKEISIDDTTRQTGSSLSKAQLEELAEVACQVEDAYGMPMDIEWAFVKNGTNCTTQLKLLQARPITTLFSIDDVMMTQPGERRVLYYDYNIVADATTMTPFTRMDMNFYGWASSAMMGFDHDIFTTDPSMPIFKASTRQYMNASLFLKYSSPAKIGESSKMIDMYLASLCASSDCDGDKYKMLKLPKGVGLRSAWRLLRQFPFWTLYKVSKECKKDPEKASQRYQEIVQQDKAKFEALRKRGPTDAGLHAFAVELFQAMEASFKFELGALFFVLLPLWKDLDAKARDGKTEEIREQASALCGGFAGDELMQMNAEIYRMAQLLPESIWNEYQHDDLERLVDRIEACTRDPLKEDLPQPFLDAWKTFLDRHGWDGQDQLFPSCQRYNDSPILLLSKVRQNHGGGGNVTNPEAILQEKIAKRREVMALQEDKAKANARCFLSSVKKIQTRNATLEHLMWIRNNPKLHLSQLCGILREHVLKIEDTLLEEGRLEEKGDIFHIDINEVDMAMQDTSMDLMSLVRRRKAIYERALRVKECPLLVDSRCRILKPDPPEGEQEEGTLVGAAISPGVARGKVRIVDNPSDYFEPGEVLVAVVTGPAWTPLFAGASGIVLQIGGVLQHGALCAREYGKPAVSNIDVRSCGLKNGLMIEVNGNTGVVKILNS